MTAEEALQILLATLPRAFAIARQSLIQLGLPNALLAVPPDLPSYLDYDLRLRCEHAQGGEVVCRLLPEPWGFWFHGEMGDSVCYAFGSRIPAALHIQLRKLHEEAEDAGMAPEQLLSILLLHEAVHVLMMSGFIGDRDYDAWRWLQELRSIHETMALKVCTLYVISSLAGRMLIGMLPWCVPAPTVLPTSPSSYDLRICPPMMISGVMFMHIARMSCSPHFERRSAGIALN